MSSSSKKKRSGGGSDAFALLMGRGGASSGGTGSGSKKRRQATSASAAAAASPRGAGAGSRYIECPACLRNVIFERLNAHLDSGCISNVSSPPRKSPIDDVAMALHVGSNDPMSNTSTSSGVGAHATIPPKPEKNMAGAIHDDAESTPKSSGPTSSAGDEKQHARYRAPDPDKDHISELESNSAASPSASTPIPAVAPPRTPALANPDISVKPTSEPAVIANISGSAYKRESKSESKNKSKNKGNNGGGVFAKMMAKSQEVFASKTAVTHYFHLHDASGKVTWTDTKRGSGNSGGVNTYWGDATTGTGAPGGSGETDSGNSGAPFISGEATNEYLKSAFSETIRIRPIKAKQRVDKLTHGRDIDLVITSSVTSAALSKERGFGLVRRHSRLSVPVLKSMLQKNIRRRRPMPAVRVAMELADKSYGDLVRRLPIMVLEDSILHPDFPLLVWLMVAESKGFKPPQQLMIRLMRIVFEVASCPIKDPLPPGDTFSEDVGNDDDTDLTDGLGTDCEMMLRAMLLRVSYGGMKCDTEMLVQYEQLWRKRFKAQMEGPEIVALHTQDPEALSQANAGHGSDSSKISEARARIAVAGGDSLQVLWSDLPAHSHEKAVVQSGDLVPHLIATRLEKLSPSDAIHNGVDFHCSAVLETVLSDKSIVAAVARRLDVMNMDSSPGDGEDKAESVMNVAKSCMWIYSSGVNHKRDLCSVGNAGVADVNDKDKQLKALWDDLLSKPAKNYTSRYVSSRLVL